VGRSESTAPGANARDRIVEVARRELATGGLAAMTIRQVARKVGVDPNSVRHYFPSKDALAIAAAREQVDFSEAFARIAEEFGPDTSAGTTMLNAASRLLFGELGLAAIAVCLAGGDYDDTALGAFHREVVLPASGAVGTEATAERAALVMAALIGAHLVDTVLPDGGLGEEQARRLLAEALDGYLAL